MKEIGFIAPIGVDPGFVNKVSASQINIPTRFVAAPDTDPDWYPGKREVDLDNLREQLLLARYHSHIVHLDFSHVWTRGKLPSEISMVFRDSKGEEHQKAFPPLESQKLRSIMNDDDLRAEVERLAPLLIEFADVVGLLFPADEPYLNGVSKEELERVSKTIKAACAEFGVPTCKMAIVFTGAMFDKDFAKYVDGKHRDYALEFDATHPASPQNPPRLTTYDQAGNLYVGGGIPEGFDVVGFDEYFSTVINDRTRAYDADYFYKEFNLPECAPFAHQSTFELQKKIGYLNGRHSRTSDKLLLDNLFSCRMNGVTRLLLRSVQAMQQERKPQLMFCSESSSIMQVEHPNNEERTNQRILDEIRRAIDFLEENQCIFDAGLFFFTYKSVRDHSIAQTFDGVDTSPRLMAEIEGEARRVVGSTKPEPCQTFPPPPFEDSLGNIQDFSLKGQIEDFPVIFLLPLVVILSFLFGGLTKFKFRAWRRGGWWKKKIAKTYEEQKRLVEKPRAN